MATEVDGVSISIRAVPEASPPPCPGNNPGRLRKLSTRPRVRLTTNGEQWRVEVLQRSWLRFGAFVWRPVAFWEFGITKRRQFTYSEDEARDRYRAELARLRERNRGWRTVESSDAQMVISR